MDLDRTDSGSTSMPSGHGRKGHRHGAAPQDRYGISQMDLHPAAPGEVRQGLCEKHEALGGQAQSSKESFIEYEDGR